MPTLQERRIEAFTPMRTRTKRVAIVAAVVAGAAAILVGPASLASFASNPPLVTVQVGSSQGNP